MEDIIRYIEEIKDLMISSPVRERLGNHENIPFQNLISKNLNEIMEWMEVLENKKDEPLKVAILGEVKSGKSSLINAILNREISEVDVLEATSNVIEISYSQDPYNKIEKDIIKIGLDLEYLKKINLVDTPGLRSITTKNEQKTLKYINHSDLIIFVIDATHIGQSDIYDVLDIIYSYNKKIVFVINKGDLIDFDKDEVMEYIRDDYGIYSEKFFMISAFIEYKDRISQSATIGDRDIIIPTDEKLKDGFLKLKKYLQQIYSDNEKIKINSMKSSVDSLTHKEIIASNDYRKSLSILLEELKKYQRLLQNKFDYMNSKMDFEINDWVNRIFLSDELNKIKNNIDNAEQYINECYINKAINDKKEELDQIFFMEWMECLKEVNNEVNEDIKKYIDNVEYKNAILNTPSFKIDNEKININEVLTTIGTGALLGVTSGGIVSVYAASVGTSATSITIGSALMTYCPPLLIVGTVSGALGKIVYDKLKTEQRNKDIIKDIEVFREEMRVNILEELKLGYENSSKAIISTTEDIFKSSKNISINKYELELLRDSIDDYINKLKIYIDN